MGIVFVRWLPFKRKGIFLFFHHSLNKGFRRFPVPQIRDVDQLALVVLVEIWQVDPIRTGVPPLNFKIAPFLSFEIVPGTLRSANRFLSGCLLRSRRSLTFT